MQWLNQVLHAIVKQKKYIYYSRLIGEWIYVSSKILIF